VVPSAGRRAALPASAAPAVPASTAAPVPRAGRLMLVMKADESRPAVMAKRQVRMMRMDVEAPVTVLQPAGMD